MLQNDETLRRPRGRPQIRPDDETRQLLIKAAAAEFQLYGYAGTGMGNVAQRAGVSTKTLYRLIPTKAELFTTVVIERTGHFMLALDDEALDALDPAEALRRILVAYSNLTLSPETIAINRLVIGECERFSEMAAAFYEHAIVGSSRRIESWLARETERGRLRIADPHAAAGMLRGMMIMEPQRAVMLGQRTLPTMEEIEARAAACAALFLDGCRSGPVA
ncbi:TetR family transcriptional regulator [Aliidongia dinghuensis]|uniref:TetR family transcriptional regulator n=1 Tax=Aliidongia dinghuensis TaxID=1867774 RepID=A0A8J2YPT5_9PROT|nr:TetR/AcrR family transcriptional regulator [Aliidongia dinghuensis]GGF04464.1 TetR family transcriptional regulator [Aliidongia dinghuensis]